ncbi:MAG TPA: glycerophosphodiester phosphodiesterase family protein [Gemmatimonadaceae bacterium]|nr:glycerophosphodiester phosphodiesterase family protein [Gemmatimonadaceae bacterium]
MNILFDITAKPVIAHRGGRARGPENTLKAMELGVAAGADAIELDVHCCATGEIVVIHDDTVDRTTDGCGAVAGMSLADIRSLDAGSRFRVAKMSCGIPTLAEVFESFPETPIIIELKTPAASAATKALIEKHNAESRCLVDSFHASALEIFSGSRIARGPSRDGLARLIVSCFLPRSLHPAVELDAICIPRNYRGLPLPVRRLAALLRSSGKPTHVWTVNDPAEARDLWAEGVCGIITDDVAAMIAARAEKERPTSLA